MITSNREISITDVAGHYDELDRFYRQVWGYHVHHGLWRSGRESPQQAVEQLIELVIEPLGLSGSSRLCDVGCGYGETARYIVSKFASSVTGITISSAQFSHAQSLNVNHLNPQIVLGDWLANDFPANAFDALISIECLAHIWDKPAFFDQVYRVLRPGSRAVITAWLEGDSYSQWQRRRLLEPICREGRLPSMGKQAEYTEMAEHSGLRLIDFQDLSSQVRKTWRVCGRRVFGQLLTSPDAIWFLIRRKSASWVFFFSIWRIRLAYRTGAMRYGMFVLEKD